PQTNGLFPAVIATNMTQVEIDGKMVSRPSGWESKSWGNSNRNPVHNWIHGGSVKDSPYHILDMSWTCLLMLRWYEELEKDERLLQYSIRFAEALLKLQDSDGFFPAWLDKDTFAVLEEL